MSDEVELSAVLDSEWISKCGKYRVKLGVRSGRAKTVWMTEKQLSQIERAFRNTPKGYSTDAVTVIGVWNEKGFYAYARVERHRREFVPPAEQNLDDLYDD